MATQNDGGAPFRLTEDVTLLLENKATMKYVKAAKGTVTLTENGIAFCPSEVFDRNAKTEYFYPINALPTVAFNKKLLILGQNNAIQAYEFSKGSTLYKWNFAVEILYKIKTGIKKRI
ncbi:MAG: hypothetical protein LBP62_06255 [Clostridiales bacterium]|jgi:hypothetical protein|nr:hypothetical protein [Clostridiales bacterium]